MNSIRVQMPSLREAGGEQLFWQDRHHTSPMIASVATETRPSEPPLDAGRIDRNASGVQEHVLHRAF